MTTTKKIEWAYSTSTNAVQFGFSKTGCYTVELKEAVCVPAKAIAGFKTIQEAEDYANTLPYAWYRLTRRAATERRIDAEQIGAQGMEDACGING